MPYSYDKLEEIANDEIAKGRDIARILNLVTQTSKLSKHIDTSEIALIKKDLEGIVAKHGNYNLIQKALNSDVYMLMDQKNKVVAYDAITNNEYDFGETSLVKLMDYKFLRPYLKPVYSEYTPHSCTKIYSDHKDRKIFNRYNPPPWKRDFFYKGTPVAPKPMPELYHKFFMSLLDNDSESYEYLINWIAISLRQKNMKMLGAIGKPRIGKGMLGTIIAELHGSKEGNGVTSVSGTKFGGRFNAILDSRTFVEFSEFKIMTIEEKNNWKNLVNTTFEMEKKGLDSKMVMNHANVFITANDMNHVRVGNSDQRLSLINLTDKMLIDRLPELGFSSEQAIADAVVEPNNIADLAAYLWNRPLDLDMGNRMFESKALASLRKSQLTPWMREFLENYCFKYAGQEKLLSEAAKALNEEMDVRLKLQKPSFEQLQERLTPMLKDHPGKYYFEIKRSKIDGGKMNVLIIAPLDMQPPEDFLTSMTVVEEA